MRKAEVILAASMITWLAGCALSGKQQAAKNAPPAPKPAAAAAAQPPAPLSIPQTNVQLPPPQPVDPGALAASEKPEEPVETLPASRPARRAPAAPAQPRAEVPAQPPPAAAQGERPRIQEIVPTEELKRLQDSANARRREVRQLLEQAQARTLTAQETSLVARIQSFVKLAGDAEARADWRQADALAQRAQILARELQSGR